METHFRFGLMAKRAVFPAFMSDTMRFQIPNYSTRSRVLCFKSISPTRQGNFAHNFPAARIYHFFTQINYAIHYSCVGSVRRHFYISTGGNATGNWVERYFYLVRANSEGSAFCALFAPHLIFFSTKLAFFAAECAGI